MPENAHDLIDTDGAGEADIASSLLAVGSPNENAEGGPKSSPSDSFAALLSLVKEKKPYPGFETPKISRRTSGASSHVMVPKATKLPALDQLKPVNASLRGQSQLERLEKEASQIPMFHSRQSNRDSPPVNQYAQYKERNMSYLDDMLASISAFDIDEAPALESPKTSLLLPEFRELDTTMTPANLPTPPPSFFLPDLIDDNEPVVCTTQVMYGATNKTTTDLTKEKKQLETQRDGLQRQISDSQSSEAVANTQYGKARYEIEAEKDWGRNLDRNLAEKDNELQRLRTVVQNLEIRLSESESKAKHIGNAKEELNYLNGLQLENCQETAINKAIVKAEEDGLYEMDRLRNALFKREKHIEELIRERDSALQTKSHASEQAIRTQNLLDTLAKREKVIKTLQQQLIDVQEKYNELSDDHDILHSKLNKENIDELKEKLREKSIEHNRLLNEHKNLERRFQQAQNNLARASNEGASLRGGAHAVRPAPNCKLPKNVFGCIACYNGNLDCDNNVKCQNCLASGQACVRWRCSLKQVLDMCPELPCKLLHDHQGWLISPQQRPKW